MLRLRSRRTPTRDVPRTDLVTAARRLRVRTRRQVTDLFAGHYVSAFRGPGIEYAESRPYVPGDDVRSFDWNATARTGVPHVKQHRPERGRTLLIALDASETMRFASTESAKLEAASEAAALLAAAALAVGDRVGLLIHDATQIARLPAGRGELQLHRILEWLVAPEAAPSKTTARPAREVPSMIEARRSRGDLVFHFTDARGDETVPRDARATDRPGARAGGEGVLVLCSDPAELRWPDAGSVRVAPSSGDGPSLVFDGDDELARRRFEQAAQRRVGEVAHQTRLRGDDFVHLRSDGDALRLWLGFFRGRAGGTSR